MNEAVLDLAAAFLEREVGLRLDRPGRERLRRTLVTMGGDPGRVVAGLALGSPDARALVSGVTLQETSWFRDPPLWAALARGVLPVLVARGGALTVWSAGCANGQEAWSLAIALSEAGAVEFEVIATDLSPAAVARAEAGVYTERELRGLDLARKRRWLRESADGGTFTVVDALRRHVRFAVHNAALDPAPVPPGACGLVLCRYLLIYLAPEPARRLLERVSAALTPDGWLAIGAAESLWHLSERWELQQAHGAALYCVRDDATARRVVRAPPRPRPAAPPPAPTPRREPPAPPPERDATALCGAGERAMSEGELETAVAAFRGAAYLTPGDPVAHMRLGFALEELGDPGAERAYRAAWVALGRIEPGDLAASLGGYRAEELVHLLAAKLGETP